MNDNSTNIYFLVKNLEPSLNILNVRPLWPDFQKQSGKNRLNLPRKFILCPVKVTFNFIPW